MVLMEALVLQRKSLVLVLPSQIQNVAWVYITTMIIVIGLIMGEKTKFKADKSVFQAF